MKQIIDKMLGWECKWKFERRFLEKDFDKEVYELYKDKNKNGLVRYKKICVNQSSSGTAYNSNDLFIKK